MSPRSLVMLTVLGAIWGAASMLIEIGLRGFDPITLIAGRLALVYGATRLDEPLRWSAVAGLALVLGGVALGTGAVGRRVASPA